MPRLHSLRPRLRTIDTRTAKPLPKKAASVYQTPEFKEWREQIVARAGRRCEAIDHHGMRCIRSEPYDRMFADHITELKDGGEPFDIGNGQCLCGSHHTAKTLAARARRGH